MDSRRRAGLVSAVVALGVTGAVGVVPAESAERAAPGVSVVTKKLDGPFGLQKAVEHRGFVVAENVSGQLTRVFKDGRQRVIVRRAAGVSGVATDADHVYAVLGGPNEEGAPPAGAYAPSSVLRTTYQGARTKVIADLLKYELAHNPDGQVQFVDGQAGRRAVQPVQHDDEPVGPAGRRRRRQRRAQGQPAHRQGVDVLRAAHGQGRQGLPGAGRERQPGHGRLRPGPDRCGRRPGKVYVSTLGAEAPGAGRVYKLTPGGKVLRVWKGLTAPTGVAVRHDGTIYVSEVSGGRPCG